MRLCGQEPVEAFEVAGKSAWVLAKRVFQHQKGSIDTTRLKLEIFFGCQKVTAKEKGGILGSLASS